jgi:hypothetical protein
MGMFRWEHLQQAWRDLLGNIEIIIESALVEVQNESSGFRKLSLIKRSLALRSIEHTSKLLLVKVPATLGT